MKQGSMLGKFYEFSEHSLLYKSNSNVVLKISIVLI